MPLRELPELERGCGTCGVVSCKDDLGRMRGYRTKPVPCGWVESDTVKLARSTRLIAELEKSPRRRSRGAKAGVDSIDSVSGSRQYLAKLRALLFEASCALMPPIGVEPGSADDPTYELRCRIDKARGDDKGF
jgi:hypothetical protein